jgi:hypothetical protein
MHKHLPNHELAHSSTIIAVSLPKNMGSYRNDQSPGQGDGIYNCFLLFLLLLMLFLLS